MIYTLTRDDIPLLSQWIKKSRSEERDFLAAELGFEPRQTESESAVLPLHNSAIIFTTDNIITDFLKMSSVFLKKMQIFENLFFFTGTAIGKKIL